MGFLWLFWCPVFSVSESQLLLIIWDHPLTWGELVTMTTHFPSSHGGTIFALENPPGLGKNVRGYPGRAPASGKIPGKELSQEQVESTSTNPLFSISLAYPWKNKFSPQEKEGIQIKMKHFKITLDF